MDSCICSEGIRFLAPLAAARAEQRPSAQRKRRLPGLRDETDCSVISPRASAVGRSAVSSSRMLPDQAGTR
jgi:hypothetical protein